ncbi:xanthine dehydrogenase family protein molybdopterin-binding subunit [Serratia quinivorans]|uniref:xanthine dehydrogenase family protein molybdopterin-binding subunit n=1 Tax=Serratia quinivorans TaxID=137545 RepID=UPI00217768F5|nr:molybdopterin cofactor-binding domain-containing protein [Serratia quinivorans]CAI0935158.1 Membrane-bound aldehyde dehydrogenase [pyrroloquinoline-quinone] precursor [Serratia quinivorans]CAI0957351.1 Membrane-bound aldehyde dehydrogenase [pyrroloquinoline-quinone] precursor [Serratia quinivorans]CAI1545824.1 Membrane-bound aldehyde dehydrogenase [pyrroloquinoline-quinone] precursor [Serratia quinivorans]CAI2067020.1 Membrane-bound aldehyde dehydrogenase [pyrroloquinoline-quinone] precursor
MAISRRTLVKGGALAVGALLLPISVRSIAAVVSQNTTPPDSQYELNDWIWIDRNGKIVIGVSQCEVGQGIYTGLAEVVAAEMDADWAQVTVKFVTGRDAYRQVAGGESFAQFVAASTSMTKFYQRTRLAGAQARDFFLHAGAKYLALRPEQCRTEKSWVVDDVGQRRVAYGDLLHYAVELPLNPTPTLKSQEQEKQGIIGKPLLRVDTPEKVDGSAIYGIDIELPGMLVGVPWMVPDLSGKIIAIRNEQQIRGIPGVIDLVLTRQWSMNNMVGLDHDMSLNTVIVVAESYWQAKKAVDLLEVEYQPGEGAVLSSDKIAVENPAMLDGGELVSAVDRGQASALIQQAVDSPRLYQANYSAPYVAHATMEPCNATSHYTAGRIETWGPFQGQDMVRNVLAKMFGLKPTDVVVNTTYLGGSFGRKYLPDAVMHATAASKAVGKPVKVIYPREIDIRHEYYRPGCISHYQALLDENGYPQALWARYAGQSLFWQMRRETVHEAGGWDESMVECVYSTPYQIPNLKVEAGIVEQPISLSYLRGVGSVASLFFLESFISELSYKANIDEYQYRRKLLQGSPEALRVLDATATAAGWQQDLPTGTCRGMSCNIWLGRNNAFTTYVCLVVELRINQGQLQLIRAVCGIDCGKVINPNLVRANVEGGIGFALTTCLKSELHFERGGVVEGNLDSYPLITIAEMPKVEVVVLDSSREPQGCGEVSTAVVAPAIASALHKATGKTYRDMPFPRQL